MKLMKKTFIMQNKIVLTIQKPLAKTNDTVMTMLMAIGIKKYAAASTVSGEDAMKIRAPSVSLSAEKWHLLLVF